MSRNAQPPQPGLTALLPAQRVLAASLAPALSAILRCGLLAAALTLAPCSQAQAAGALPWLAPGQQSNGTAQDANATAPAPQQNAAGQDASTPAPTPTAPGTPAQAVAAPATAAPVNAAPTAPTTPAQAAAAPATATTVNATPVNAAPTAPTTPAQAAAPVDAAGLAQLAVLRQYFRQLVTLDEGFPEVFSRRVKDGETLAFLAMCEMQRRRGLLERFRAAEVDLEELVFTRVTADPDLARIRVTGRYSFSVPPVQKTVEEDALFVLLPEMGEWKIFERREGWRP